MDINFKQKSQLNHLSFYGPIIIVLEKFQMHNIVEVGAASHKRFHKIVDYGRIQFRENPFKFGVRAKKSQDEPTMWGDYISKEWIKRWYMTTAKQKKLLDEDSTNHGLIWSL